MNRRQRRVKDRAIADADTGQGAAGDAQRAKHGRAAHPLAHTNGVDVAKDKQPLEINVDQARSRARLDSELAAGDIGERHPGGLAVDVKRSAYIVDQPHSVAQQEGVGLDGAQPRTFHLKNAPREDFGPSTLDGNEACAVAADDADAVGDGLSHEERPDAAENDDVAAGARFVDQGLNGNVEAPEGGGYTAVGEVVADVADEDRA